MESSIIKLQQECLDKNVRVSDLLRKAFVISRKLKLKEFQEWIEKELNGYGGTIDIPEYREVSGQIRAWNPVNGWIPIIFEDPKQGELLSRRKTGQTIAVLESLAEGGDKNSSIHMPFSQNLQTQLCKHIGYPTEVTLFTSRTSIVGIIDTVRTILLNWSLKLEEEGILGEGLFFSDKEKEAAGKNPQSVTNFFGPVNSPQIQQGSPQSIQVKTSMEFEPKELRDFITNLKKTIESLSLDSDQLSEAEAEIKTIESQVESPRPKTSIIREGLGSIRRILEGASGGATAHLLIEIGKLLI